MIQFLIVGSCFDDDLCKYIVFLSFSDFGFDPLRLGAVPENLERFKESELIHCRWAMLAVVSVSFKEAAVRFFFVNYMQKYALSVY